MPPPTDGRRGLQPLRQMFSRGRQRPRSSSSSLASSPGGGGGGGGVVVGGGGAGRCSGGGSDVCDVRGAGGGVGVRVLADGVRGGVGCWVSGSRAFPPCAFGDVGCGSGRGVCRGVGVLEGSAASAFSLGAVGAPLSSGEGSAAARVSLGGASGVDRWMSVAAPAVRVRAPAARRARRWRGFRWRPRGTVRVSSGVIVCLPPACAPGARGVRTVCAGGGAAQASRSYVTRTGGPFSSMARGCHDRGEPS